MGPVNEKLEISGRFTKLVVVNSLYSDLWLITYSKFLIVKYKVIWKFLHACFLLNLYNECCHIYISGVCS